MAGEQATTATVRISGPLLRGAGPAVVEAFVHAAPLAVGREGVDMVRAELHTVLQNPTGYYESQVAVQPTPDGASVSDSGVIYGPWLEGVGSRNQTTRFKGYATFRRTTQTLARRVPEIVQPLVDLMIRGLS